VDPWWRIATTLLLAAALGISAAAGRIIDAIRAGRESTFADR
jgi:hypothetical protein